jgi:hypothetical protein
MDQRDRSKVHPDAGCQLGLVGRRTRLYSCRSLRYASAMKSCLASALSILLACPSCSDDRGDGAGGSGGSGGTQSCASGFEAPCDELPCCEGDYCRTTLSNCGASSTVPPICVALRSCSPEPACGCDGQVYPRACDANAAGLDIGEICAPGSWPEGRVPCGGLYCDAASQYCHVLGINDTGEDQDEYDCRDVPAVCNGSTEPSALCDCISGSSGCGSCYSCEPIEGNGVIGVRVDEAAI